MSHRSSIAQQNFPQATCFYLFILRTVCQWPDSTDMLHRVRHTHRCAETILADGNLLVDNTIGKRIFPSGHGSNEDGHRVSWG